MALPDQVTIREITHSDGLQSWPELVPTQTKVDTEKAVTAAGVGRFENTSFVSLKIVPQIADTDAVLKSVPHDGVAHYTFVCNLKGAQFAVETGADQINVVVSASKSHNVANFRRTIAESLSALEPNLNQPL
jgi:hydroxymethylglutaryl-CoA lyase